MEENKSFYDWCIENNHQEILDAWDYEKNEDTPKDLGAKSKKIRYFKCFKCGKSWPHRPNNIVAEDRLPPCKYCNSFGVWCLEHKRKDLLKRWDYELNKCDPFNVAKGSNSRKYYFKCPRGIHPSEAKRLDHVISSYTGSRCNMCNSFGQWGIDKYGEDFLKTYWSDKNTVSPFSLAKASNVKVWIKCVNTDYHQDYQVSCNCFQRGYGCPYCGGYKVDIHDSLGVLYPESQEFWFQKNITPFDVLPGSNKKVYWKCEKHGLYRRSVDSVVKAGFICPKCNYLSKESSFETRTRLYLEERFGKENVLHENYCTLNPVNPETKMPLRYDNEVVPLKLIIQVNGQQHYDPADKFLYDKDNPRQQFAYRKKLDEYKKEYALNHGYHYLEIPYWEYKTNAWKKSIDEAIESIMANTIK